jgi:hypothetical protein
MSNDNPLGPLEGLAARCEEANAPLGLEMQGFGFSIPNDEQRKAGMKPSIQVIFTIDMERVGQDVEQAEFDAKFEEMTMNFENDKKQEQTDDAIADLKEFQEMRKRFKEGGGTGIFGGEQ